MVGMRVPQALPSWSVRGSSLGHRRLAVRKNRYIPSRRRRTW